MEQKQTNKQTNKFYIETIRVQLVLMYHGIQTNKCKTQTKATHKLIQQTNNIFHRNSTEQKKKKYTKQFFVEIQLKDSLFFKSLSVNFFSESERVNF